MITESCNGKRASIYLLPGTLRCHDEKNLRLIPFGGSLSPE